MIAASFASARSGLLSIADSIVRRVASGDADGLGGLAFTSNALQPAARQRIGDEGGMLPRSSDNFGGCSR
jgi:hypothetical protein